MDDGERVCYLVPDLVRLTGLKEAAIRHLIDRRLIPSRRLGRRVVVLPDELRAYLRSLRRPGEELDGDAPPDAHPVAPSESAA